jgi:hypothetical protein
LTDGSHALGELLKFGLEGSLRDRRVDLRPVTMAARAPSSARRHARLPMVADRVRSD